MANTVLRTLVAILACAPLVAQDNVLLLVADDLGVDRVAAYGEHPEPGLTPNIDQLAAEGVLFRNCWANPLCSPTRATIMTGRYCFRTGIGWYINPWQDPYGLMPQEWTLPRAITRGSQGEYATVLIGKWHLAGVNQGPLHPNALGWNHYSGQPNNLVNGQDYFDWQKVTDGITHGVHAYATSETVDDALARIADLGDRPWFLCIGFHAPHFPIHAPPGELHDYDLSGDPGETPFEHGLAMVQAMDTEIGRLLAGIHPPVRKRTTVIFVGDNGTDKPLCAPPFEPGHAKNTLFEGGVNVPLIVAGRGVGAMGAECAALVNASDLFRTVCDLVGVPASSGTAGIRGPVDSVSLLPYLDDPAQPSLRSFVYAERFAPIHGQPPFDVLERAVRGARFKLIQNVKTGGEAFYDLEADPFETVDLLPSGLDDAQLAAYLELEAALAGIAFGT